MTTPIESAPAAEKLAREILADLAIANAARIRFSGNLRANLAAEIDEARAQFEARVSRDLHGVFDRELSGWFEDIARGASGEAANTPVTIAAPLESRVPAVPARRNLAVGVSLAAIVLVAALAWLARCQ